MSEIILSSIAGISRFSALMTMAELGCADHLAEGPLSVEELAGRCGADVPALARVLRELAAIGVVRTVEPGRYALTADGAALRDDVPGSLRSAVRMVGGEAFWYALGNLHRTVRHGRSAFEERFGPLYEYLMANPEPGRLFHEYMVARSVPLAAAVANSYDFTGIRTLVDVAGGKGHILAAVLAGNPDMKGVLFDLEHVLPGARQTLTGYADRCDFVSGDFFAHVPSGADAYLLGSVIHNWDDDDAVRILGNTRKAMADDGRVLILEMVLPAHDEPHPGKDTDMRMLAIFSGGTERTAPEYAALLEKSGLSMTVLTELTSGASLIEARPI